MGVSEKALICGKEIEKFIPQRSPMIMISGFHGIEEEIFHTSLEILEENIFCENGVFCEAGIIEHIAQSCAFRNGYLAINCGQKVQLGYIGAVTAMRIYSLPKCGSTIKTRISIEQEFMGISLVKAVVECCGSPIAEGKVKVALIEKEN